MVPEHRFDGTGDRFASALPVMEHTDFERLVIAHSRFPAVVGNLIEGVDLELLRARETDGRWSPLEILVHLRDEELEDFRPRAQAAAEGRPIDRRIDPEGWVTKRAYNTQDPIEVMDRLRSEREISCRWLRSLDVETLARELTLGDRTMRCGDFIASWRMHDLLHLRQLATALTLLTAHRLEGWDVAYAGRIPTVARS